MTQVVEVGLRARKRRATRERIAAEAARLAVGHGITGTTVDDIVEAAGISRATFFRYFEAKEFAIAAGLSEVWISFIISELEQQAPGLSAMEAVRATFATLGKDFDNHRNGVLEQAHLSRTSVALQAWTLHLYVEFEKAIAAAVAHRFRDLADNDIRPRLVGAATMAVLRFSLDRWTAEGGHGDLPSMIEEALAAVDVADRASARRRRV